MKAFKIYGTKYPLEQTTSAPADCYGYKGELVDDLPKGKMVGYVAMEDESIIECYKKFNPLVIILPILLVLVLAGLGLVYLLYFQPKDVVLSSTFIKLGVDNNVVTYNGYIPCQDNLLYVDFQNGAYPATISVQGDGIEAASYSIEPDIYVETIPATFTTDEGVVEATLTIKTETSTATFPVVVEIPDNLNDNDKFEGPVNSWQGETIYGVGPEDLGE